MDTMIKESVAVLFSHVIKVNNKDLDVERPLFCRFMQQDFNLSFEESSKLLDEVMENDDYSIDTHIAIISNALHNQTYKKMSVLKQLNHILFKSNLEDDDYDFFDKVKKAFFPN